MSILVYSGLRELIKRQFHDRDMATIDATANSIYSMIGEVMSDYRAKAIQIVGTLPVTGVAGTIYVMSKSEPNEKNRFIAYVFENGKYVQVGSSFFPEDFEHDAALSTTSHVTVENRAIHAELQNKYNVSNVIDNVVYNDEHGIHANDTPTSAAIKRELDTKMGYEDGSRISDEMLWQIFRPELTQLVYPKIEIGLTYVGGSDSWNSIGEGIYRFAGVSVFTNMIYKSQSLPDNYTVNAVLFDSISDRDVRVRCNVGGNGVYAEYNKRLFDNETYPNEAYIQTAVGNKTSSMSFTFLDPVTIGLLKNLILNIRGYSSKPTNLTVTTKISYTGYTDNDEYIIIQDKVVYSYTHTTGIPFYSRNN